MQAREYLVYLHQRAVAGGRVDQNETATALFAGIAGATSAGADEDAYAVGVELRNNRAQSRAARQILRVVRKQLWAGGSFLGFLDEAGYSPFTVRVLLQMHYWRWRQMPPGSDEHTAALDVEVAVSRLPAKEQFILWCLSYGAAPQEIVALLADPELTPARAKAALRRPIATDRKVNGSRTVRAAIAALSRELRGGANVN